MPILRVKMTLIMGKMKEEMKEMSMQEVSFLTNLNYRNTSMMENTTNT